MSVHWPDSVDEILGGDQVVALAYATPAHGVVVTPMVNFGGRDREAGTLAALNTSIGTWKKLKRIRANPKVALAYHTRTHGFSERPEFVLVQGTAALEPARADYADTVPQWERFAGRRPRGVSGRWLRVYNTRVGITVTPERMLVWPDLACTGEPQVLGASLPAEDAQPQRPPAKGTRPRIRHERAAKRAALLPHVLLGWIGADGFPVIAPVGVAGSEDGGIVLEAPDGLVPRGGRRAGLVAHAFARYSHGQRLSKHTGWLEAGEGRLLYAPHTETAYTFPGSTLLFTLVAGATTRMEEPAARRAGFAPP